MGVGDLVLYWAGLSRQRRLCGQACTCPTSPCWQKKEPGVIAQAPLPKDWVALGESASLGLSLLDRQMGTILALSPSQDYHDIQMSSCLEWP